jgi:hypothetical protein
MDTTTMKDYWTEGYEAPCKANGFQSNKPSAFEIDLHYMTEGNVNRWLLNTEKEIERGTENPHEMKRLTNQLKSIKAEIAYRSH